MELRDGSRQVATPRNRVCNPTAESGPGDRTNVDMLIGDWGSQTRPWPSNETDGRASRSRRLLESVEIRHAQLRHRVLRGTPAELRARAAAGGSGHSRGAAPEPRPFADDLRRREGGHLSMSGDVHDKSATGPPVNGQLAAPNGSVETHAPGGCRVSSPTVAAG